MNPTAPPVHEAIAPLAGLLGTWTGVGQGEYPTIGPFQYAETVTIGHVGKPFLAYSQRTQNQETGLPMHAETGYWRMSGPTAVELLIAQPTGLVEILEGTLAQDAGVKTIRLRSSLVGRTASAKDVTVIERDWTLAGDALSYEVRMAAVGYEISHHLAAQLHRAD